MPRNVWGISIHAPREGSDLSRVFSFFKLEAISIHAPREGSDVFKLFFGVGFPNFNPRSP